MVWITNFPLYEPNVRRFSANGKQRVSVSGYRKSKALADYHKLVDLFCKKNESKIQEIKLKCQAWIAEGKMLRVDTYHVFDSDRIWTKDGKPKKIDANNRVKACLDAVSTMIDIDDKYFFDGDCAKIISTQKESECAIIRISPVKPQTLDQLRIKIMAGG
jgi:Endodeoxyribonuclease RusA